MEGKRRIFDIILKITVLCVAAACSHFKETRYAEIHISFSSGAPECRSAAPDEDRISDISLMIFDANGAAEECLMLKNGRHECSVRLIAGQEYIFCACANFGYQVYADNIGELDEMRFHLAYPDEYREGVPMYAYEKILVREGGGEIVIPLQRLMSKISLRMDRRRLSDDVLMKVRSVKIGNCPRSAAVFLRNKVKDEDECFPLGFSLSGAGTDRLNETSESGLSGSVSLYMLENMQGRMDREISSDEEKVFDAYDIRRETCSYIEMELDYSSDTYYSKGKGLVYRFYLGEDRSDLNVERNCHYRITVTPEDDGLSDDGWRVDKSGLQTYEPPYFKAHPADYIVGDIGDRIHIWCDVSPSGTPFDVGISYMEDDRKEGIYDYEIDADGHGATLTLTGPGRGLIYMEAGPPVNDAALFIIEVNLPD